MELNLFKNIFKKKPGNIPPGLAMRAADMVRSSKGKGEENKGILLSGFVFFFPKKQERPGNPPNLVFPPPPR